MPRSHSLLALAGVLTASCIAAGDATTDPGVDDPPDAALPTASTTVILEGVLADDQRAPIAGAEICVLERPELGCANSDPAGFFAVAVPVDEPIHVRVTAHLFYPRLYRLDLVDDARRAWTLAPDTWLVGQMLRWGIALEPAVGMVMLDADGDAAALSLSAPPDGMECAFLDDDGHLELDLGMSEQGVQYCFGIPPGIYTSALFAPQDMRCVDAGWPFDRDVRVEPGHLTVVEARCDDAIVVTPQ